MTVGSIGSIRSGAIGTVGSMEYDGRRPRVSKELAARIDGVRGQVPFERWVREALEAALAVKDPVVETSAGLRAQSSFKPGEVVEVPEFPPREVKPDPPTGVPLPKIAKRKW